MGIFAEFGALRSKAADDGGVQALVKKLQGYISEHYYTCGNEVLSSLGNMYAADGEFRSNIDKAGGNGTAEFVSAAIAEYCKE